MTQQAISHHRRLYVWRGAAWLCVALITVLSLVPHDMEVRTPAPAGLEHAIAYAGTAGLMALAYRSRSVWLIIGLLAAYSALMELLQIFSPGRHPSLDGVLWSSAGTVIGAWGQAVMSGFFPVAGRIERANQPERTTGEE